MLLFDGVVFGLTFAKGMEHGRTCQGGTLRVMLRDGKHYPMIVILLA